MTDININTIYNDHKNDDPIHRHIRGESIKQWCGHNGERGEVIESNFTGIHLESQMRYAMDSVSKGTNDKYIWKCHACGEIYASRPDSLTIYNKIHAMSCGCPKCSIQLAMEKKPRGSLYSWCIERGRKGKKQLKMFTGIGAGKDKGKTFKASEIAPFGRERTIWRCRKGHEWEANTLNISGKTRCPDCAKVGLAEQLRKRQIKENGSLLDWCNDEKNLNGATVKAEFTGRIDFDNQAAKRLTTLDRNKPIITMDYVPPQSNIPVYWKCIECGYEWPVAINCRTKGGTGCPECAKRRMSVPEAFIRYSLAQVFPKLQANIRIPITEINDKLGFDIREEAKEYQTGKIEFFSKEAEYDIYIPEQDLYIEYGNTYTHGERMLIKDAFKEEYATTILGARFICITDTKRQNIDDSGNNIYYTSGRSFDDHMEQLKDIVARICRDYCGLNAETIASIDFTKAYNRAKELDHNKERDNDILQAIKDNPDMSYEQIATLLGIERSLVYTVCVKHGIRQRLSQKDIEIRDRKIARMIEKNPAKSSKEIAEMCGDGVSTSIVSNTRKKLGISKASVERAEKQREIIADALKEHPELTTGEIAQMLGIKRCTVRNLAKRQGIVREKASTVKNHERNQKILELLNGEKQLKFREIADIVGVSYGVVKDVAHKNGIYRSNELSPEELEKRNSEIYKFMVGNKDMSINEVAEHFGVTTPIINYIRFQHGLGKKTKQDKKKMKDNLMKVTEEHPEMNAQQIADMLGVSIHVVHNTWKDRGYSKMQSSKEARDKYVMNIIMDNPEMSDYDIADMTGFSRATIYHIRKRNGYMRREQ